MKDNQFNQDDFDFIVDALNFYWNNAVIKLQNRSLGDIEKENYITQKEKSMNLMRYIMGRVDPQPLIKTKQ